MDKGKQRIQISLMIDQVPSKKESCKPRSKKPSIEEEVQHAIYMCESDHDSGADWEFLKRVYNSLTKRKKLGKRQENLLKLIEPFLKRHESANPSKINYDVEKSSKAGSLFKL